MTKRLLATLLALAMACALLPTAALAADSDFVIDENGVLTQYTGPGGDVVIPDGVTGIGRTAFYRCASLTSVTIPDSVTTIGYMAFYWCANLADVTIPAGVTDIEDGAFGYCENLTDIAVAEDNPAYILLDGVLFTKDMTEIVAYPSKRSGPYAIPEGVTTIKELVFSWCDSLTSVTIPESVTTIKPMAFNRSRSLTDITVAEGNPVYTSQDGVVFNKDKTKIMAFPGGRPGPYTIPDSVTAIEDRTFQDCPCLTGLTIPAGVVTIGEYAFGYCSRLVNITVAEGNPVYTSQDGVVFRRDKTELIAYPSGKSGPYIIPNGVTAIGDHAFLWCVDLTSVTIPDSVTTIGGGVFYDCPALTSITIPASVTSIGYGVFYYCPILTVYGYTGSEAERYCVERDIPFGVAPGTDQTGSLESDSGESVSWAITEEGEITIDVTADLAPEEKILVGCYDENGRFTGVKWLDAQHATAQIDPATPNVKIFWLGAGAKPQSPSVTVWGR